LNRYPLDYPAFKDRDLSSQGYLELTPNTEFCNLSVGVEDLTLSDLNIDIYPNPVDHTLIIAQTEKTIDYLFLADLTGRIVKEIIITSNRTTVDVSELSQGLYFLRSESGAVSKVVIH